MTEYKDHTKIDQNLLFKYAIRLMSVAEAKDFENHLNNCDDCAQQLGEISHFFELLQNSISINVLMENASARTTEKPEMGMAEKSTATMMDERSAINNMLQNPTGHNLDDILTVLKGCFNGFQKLCRNISAQMNGQIETVEIEQAALEILLALPKQVSRI